MSKWEYTRTFYWHKVDYLARDGWQLISVVLEKPDVVVYYLKRKKKFTLSIKKLFK